MGHEVAPALARKFGEPGGLFDTALQRLVSEWHRFQVDRDPQRLAALDAILEAGLSQLRSLELLLESDGRSETELEIDRDFSHAAVDPDVRAVYAADPRAAPEPSPRDRESASGALSPSRLEEATRLLDSLHAALQDVLSLGETLPRAPASPEPTRAEPTPYHDLPRRAERRSRPETARGEATLSPDLTFESAEPQTAPPPSVAPSEPPADHPQPVAESVSSRSERPIDEIFPREAFDVASAAELKRCRRFERSFSLLLLDAGVEVDRRAARILLSNLREFDLVGRYGDDVFAIGLPETSAEAARVIAERLVGLLARRGAWSDRGRLGFATYPRDGNTLTTVVRSARAALSDESLS